MNRSFSKWWRCDRLSNTRQIAWVLLALALAPCGCNDPNWSFDKNRRARASKSDIYKVVCFYPPNMWRSFDEAGDRNIEGFTFILYLISSSTQRGALVDGTIEILLYRVDTVEGKQSNRVLAFEWSRDTSEIAERNPTKLGHGYQPSVNWETLDLFGKEVEIVVRHIAPDGTIIPSRTATLKVPARKL